jgi:hypothetical protein
LDLLTQKVISSKSYEEDSRAIVAHPDLYYFLVGILFVLRYFHNCNQTNIEFRLQSKRTTQNMNDKKSTSSAECQGITKDASIAKHMSSRGRSKS